MELFLRKKHFMSTLLIAMTLAFASLSYFAGSAFAGWGDDYGGWGHFTTSNLNWCHVGTDYNLNQQAASKWSADTDINISTNCNAEHVTTVVDNFGDDGYAGYAYICSYPYCNNSTAWNNNYSSCEARTNTFYVDSSGYTYNQRRKVATHELGHCWSLGHRDSTVESDSVMRTNTPTLKLSTIDPNSTDETLVNDRY